MVEVVVKRILDAEFILTVVTAILVKAANKHYNIQVFVTLGLTSLYTIFRASSWMDYLQPITIYFLHKEL